MQKSFIYQASIISYRVEGKGVPVILLHGFGEDSHIWDQQISLLKEHCLLIIPDLPGSGKSSILSLEPASPAGGFDGQHHLMPNPKPQTPNHITIDDYANCIHVILKEELITSCYMLGHSMGGYITLAFAEKYPSLLKGFGLIHSSAYADNEEKIKIRERAIDFIAQYGAHAFLKTAIPNLFGTTFKKEHYHKVDELINAAIVFTKETLQQYYRAMILRTDKTAVLQGNPLPILFVIGTEDAAVPMEDMLHQTSMPLHSHIHILKDIGHMSMWEAPEELNQFILSFISA